jgi:plastocyanin
MCNPGLLLIVALSVASAAEVEGVITITKTLTRRKVTPSVGDYQRGVAVKLGAEPVSDPLAFERTRVVIYLEGNAPSTPVTAVIEQKDRRFLPDTIVIPAGSSVSFPNLDPIFHNVFSLSKAKAFDLGNYAKDQTRVVAFQKPGIVFVHCHLHPNMAAAIVVTPNRYFSRGDAEGRFHIPDVPPGRYTVVAWHKAAGFFRKTIDVTAKGPARVDFLIPIAPDALQPSAGLR